MYKLTHKELSPYFSGFYIWFASGKKSHYRNYAQLNKTAKEAAKKGIVFDVFGYLKDTKVPDFDIVIATYEDYQDRLNKGYVEMPGDIQSYIDAEISSLIRARDKLRGMDL